MTWKYKGKPVENVPEKSLGFVYLITNKLINKKYIGQKLLEFRVTRKPLKGKTQKRHSRVQSDWKTYYGSSDDLKEDLKLIGETHFTREILYFCTSKSEMNYLEAKLQMDNDVLFRDDFYNGIINIRTKKSKNFKKRLDYTPKLD